MLFKWTYSLHKTTLEVIRYTHNLTSSLHLCCKCSLCRDKLIKWKSRYLNYTVVKCWLETCICLSCNCVLNLIKCITKCNLSCNLGNRITCSLRSKCWRTAYTRVNLNNAVFKAVWMKCILYVTSTCNTKLIYNVKCRCSKHLIFFIWKCLWRSNYNTITCMYTNWIDILHITYSYACSVAVTHYLIFDFLPARYTSFNKNFTNSWKS